VVVDDAELVSVEFGVVLVDAEVLEVDAEVDVDDSEAVSVFVVLELKFKYF